MGTGRVEGGASEAVMGIDDKQAIVRLTEQRDALLEACRAAAFVLHQLKETEPLFQKSWNVNQAMAAVDAAIAQAEAVQPVQL